jgi:hypothetical protein
MALTKPRAYQIYDIDYKQAVRVVSTSNVTLAGGAPNSVDGVTLSLNDRVLVVGQTGGAQNGIYYVTTLGSGANGTWTRAVDTDTTGELLSGTIVMVTEGTAYADTQWKLTTNDPITIGSTVLTFVQNYLANSISFGNTAFAISSTNANATISVAGTSNVAVFATTGEYVTGVISATGNITSAAYVFGNVFFATGITASKIYNGNSEVNISASGGPANISIGGTSNVAVFSSTGLAITGDLSVSGNATLSGNILGDRLQNGTTSIDIQTASGNANISVAGISNVVVFSSSGQNVAGYITSTGNITGNYLLGNAFFATGITANKIYNGTTEVAIGSLGGNANISVGGTSNVVVFTTAGLNVSGVVSATGNITGSNLNITGDIVDTGALSIITGSNGNIALAPNGTGIVTASGNISAVGNIIGGNLITGDNSTIYGGYTTLNNQGVFQEQGVGPRAIGLNIASGYGIGFRSAGGATDQYIYSSNSISFVTGATLASKASPSFGAGSNTGVSITQSGFLSVVGNTITGNLLTAGQVSATGNVLAGNLIATANLRTTGNLYVGTGNAGYVYGNATFMTGITAAISVSKIENGNSNVWVQSAGGDVTVTAGGVSNVAVFSTGSMTLQGAIGTPKTITSNIIVAGGINAMLIGPLVFGNGYNLTVPDSSTVYVYSPMG